MKESEGFHLWLEETAYGPGRETESLFVQELSKILPRKEDLSEKNCSQVYDLSHRKKSAIFEDTLVRKVDNWLRNPYRKPQKMDNRKWQRFLKMAAKFFVYEERLYRKSSLSQHQLVVLEEN
jgi:hypothetical protein